MAPSYVAAELLRESLNIVDDDREALLQDAMRAASRAIDKNTHRRFWLDAEPVARTFNPRGRVVHQDGEKRFLVPDIGDDQDLVVEIGTPGAWQPVADVGTAPDNALVDLQPVTELLLYGALWPTGRQRVRVTARWGWPAVPDEVVTATRLLAARLFRRKDSPEGVMGSAEWGVLRLSRTDPDVHALISSYIIPEGFG